jgi:hypothetical protein
MGEKTMLPKWVLRKIEQEAEASRLVRSQPTILEQLLRSVQELANLRQCGIIPDDRLVLEDRLFREMREIPSITRWEPIPIQFEA